MEKTTIQINTNDKSFQEKEIDLDELKKKAQQRALSNDDIQNILNYLLNK